MKKLIAGNWKMNGLNAEVTTLAAPLAQFMMDENSKFDMLVCPPFLLLDKVVQIAKTSNLKVGAQDCSIFESGAHTGDISAKMIADMDADFVIVGHSERRADHAESSEIVRQKAEMAIKNGLTVIICVGESKQQRESGEFLDVIGDQLSKSIPENANFENTVIAYEPVWAIGTGLVASVDNVKEVHEFIYNQIKDKETRLLYGGSVKPDNAGEIMNVSHVDGVLVGGAALDAESFKQIANNA
jgi:triosephosphate isomerase